MINVFTKPITDEKIFEFKLSLGKKGKFKYFVKSIEIHSKDKVTCVTDNQKLSKYNLNLEIDDLKIFNDVNTQIFSNTITTELNHEIDPQSVFKLQATPLTSFDEIIDVTFVIEYFEAVSK